MSTTLIICALSAALTFNLVPLISINRCEAEILAQRQSGDQGNNRQRSSPPAASSSRETWRTPITFYGKVVDELNSPVAGATVKFLWQTADATPENQMSSDGQGSFVISGINGKALEVHVEKDGYYSSRLERNFFEYGDRADKRFHSPNPIQPVMFTLRRKGRAEALIRWDKKFPIQIARPLRIRLDTGATDQAGECRIDLLENSVKPKSWAIRLALNQGGAISFNDEFPFLAPDSGYENSLEIHFDPANPRFPDDTLYADRKSTRLNSSH